MKFRIHGLDCAEEVAILRRELQPLVGGAERLAFDVLRGELTVRPGLPSVTSQEITAAGARTGMRAEPAAAAAQGKAIDLSFWRRRGRAVLTACSAALTAAGFATHAATGGVVAALGSEGAGVSHAVPMAAIVFYAGAIVSGGWFVLPRALFAARRGRPDMHLLMTIAVIGAVAIGEWFEGAVVSLLFALALALEAWSVQRARRAVEALLAIAPPTARLLQDNGASVEVPVSNVAVGAHILVTPGERIPLDGVVRQGLSLVNQAAITGESIPVEKGAGVEVFAGSINGEGALHVEVTRSADDTMLASIIRMVAEAQGKRSPSEQWVDRFARMYTPAILGLAIAVAILPPLIAGDWSSWFYRALVLLVIGCPCALVISTPVSIVAALASAARHGVLVKSGPFMEAPAKLKAVALDKTGTLTTGMPSVTAVVALNGDEPRELLHIAASIEAQIDHPVARAIVAYAREQDVTIAPAVHVQALNGRGVAARVDGQEYWLGSPRYLRERGHETAAIHEQVRFLSSSGHTVVAIGSDTRLCGLVTLADTVRDEAAPAVAALRAAGIEHVVMLTGDTRVTAERIAQAAGVTEVEAELLPGDKVRVVDTLVDRYGAVAMVGDGVNDAPAMARATIGIAMGAAGSDAAVEVADIALMSDDLLKLPWLINHARRTLTVIQHNIALALGVKALFVALTFLGYAALWAAIAADMGISLVVIANALRLLYR